MPPVPWGRLPVPCLHPEDGSPPNEGGDMRGRGQRSWMPPLQLPEGGSLTCEIGVV